MKAEQVHENTDQAALYFNRRENYFLIAAIAKQGYGSIEVGEPVKVAGLEFDSRIGQVLSQVLDSFTVILRKTPFPNPQTNIAHLEKST